MVDCLTLCNSSCITCIWCILLSLCFPKYFDNFEDTDSNKCSFRPVARPPRHCREPEACRRSRVHHHHHHHHHRGCPGAGGGGDPPAAGPRRVGCAAKPTESGSSGRSNCPRRARCSDHRQSAAAPAAAKCRSS